MKISAKISIVLASVIAAASVGTVAATWTFTTGAGTEVTENIDLDLASFRWSGSEVLPSGEGSNHMELIERIISAINGTLDDDDNYTTLNDNIETRADPSSIDLNYESRNYYGSTEKNTRQDSVVDLLNDDTGNLSFIITWTGYGGNGQYESLTIYTTSVNLGGRGESDTYLINRHYNTKNGEPTIPYGEYIYCIYKTTLTYNDETSAWEADTTEAGLAPFFWYEENQEYGAQAKQIPSFDFNNWISVDDWVTAGNDAIGSTQAAAIWTFDGDTPAVYADSADEVWCYKMATTGAITMEFTTYEGTGIGRAGYVDYSIDYSWNQAGTYNFATTALNAELVVYDSSGSKIVWGTRETPSVTTETASDGTITKIQTTTDTVYYKDGSYVITTYVVTTITEPGEEPYARMDGRQLKYGSDNSLVSNMDLFNETGSIDGLTLDFYASESSYYYFTAAGATEIPLSLDRVSD